MSYADPKILENAIIEQYPDIGLTLHLVAMQRHKTMLNIISIGKQHQRQGIGRDILRQICDWADTNAHTITLSPVVELGSSYYGLVRLYKSFGFILNTGKDKNRAIFQSMYRIPVLKNYPPK